MKDKANEKLNKSINCDLPNKKASKGRILLIRIRLSTNPVYLILRFLCIVQIIIMGLSKDFLIIEFVMM